MHTVKFTKTAYLVLDAKGKQVARYPFDATDFQDSRRPAYRMALEDAAIRDKADEKALVTALINGCDACDTAASKGRMLFAWSGVAADWVSGRKVA